MKRPITSAKRRAFSPLQARVDFIANVAASLYAEQTKRLQRAEEALDAGDVDAAEAAIDAHDNVTRTRGLPEHDANRAAEIRDAIQRHRQP